MQVDIPAALQELKRVADRIEELLEWEKLAQQERGSRALPPFQLRDHDRKDIIDLFGWFLNLSMSIHEVLDRPDFEALGEQRQRWQRRLRALEERVQGLGIIDKYIKP